MHWIWDLFLRLLVLVGTALLLLLHLGFMMLTRATIIALDILVDAFLFRLRRGDIVVFTLALPFVVAYGLTWSI